METISMRRVGTYAPIPSRGKLLNKEEIDNKKRELNNG